jgi:hypothetical protein
MQRVLVFTFLCNKFGASVFTNVCWGICVRSARLYETHLYIKQWIFGQKLPGCWCGSVKPSCISNVWSWSNSILIHRRICNSLVSLGLVCNPLVSWECKIRGFTGEELHIFSDTIFVLIGTTSAFLRWSCVTNILHGFSVRPSWPHAFLSFSNELWIVKCVVARFSAFGCAYSYGLSPFISTSCSGTSK